MSIEEILGKQIHSVKELREEIKRLQDSLVGVDAESEEFKNTTKKLTAAQEELSRVTSAGKKETDAAKDSIAGLEKAYKDLYKQYRLLSEEQRNSDFGKNMAQSLKSMSKQINQQKLDVGNLTSNIGNYEKAITSAFQKMGISADGLTKAFNISGNATKALTGDMAGMAGASEGLVAALGAVAVALAVVAALIAGAAIGIKNNEELQMRWNEALATFQPLINGVKNILDQLGQALVFIVEKATNAVVWLEKVNLKFREFLGLEEKGAAEAFQKEIDNAKELAKRRNDYIKNERNYRVWASKQTAEVERLREEASAAENAADKNRLLNQAKELQAEIDQKSLELAQENLDILKEEAALNPDSTEDLNKLADAEIKVNNAVAQAERNARMFNKQLAGTKTSANGATDELKKLAEEAKKVYSRTVVDDMSTLEKLDATYKQEYELLKKFGYDTTLLTKQYTQKRREIELSEMTKTAKDIERHINSITDKTLQAALRSESADEKVREITELYNQLENINSQYTNAYKKGIITEKELFGVLELEDKEFSQLGETFGDFNKKVDEMNAKYGVAITNASTLNSALSEAKNEAREAANAFQEVSASNLLSDKNLALMEEEMNILRGGFGEDFYEQVVAENNREYLEYEREVLAKQLLALSGTTQEKIELTKRYYEVLKELREGDWELEKLQKQRKDELIQAEIDGYLTLNDSIISVSNSIATLMQAELQYGKLSESERKKKINGLKNLEKVMMVVNIASVVAETAAALTSLDKGYAGETVVNSETAVAAGPAAAPTKAALDAASAIKLGIRKGSVLLNGAANIAAIISGSIAKLKSYDAQLEDESTADTVAVGTPSLIDSTGYSYYQELQTDMLQDSLNKPTYVTVTDILEGIDHKVEVVDETSF